jgi:hypothetical protein
VRFWIAAGRSIPPEVEAIVNMLLDERITPDDVRWALRRR